jgi:hypothetical protein
MDHVQVLFYTHTLSFSPISFSIIFQQCVLEIKKRDSFKERLLSTLLNVVEISRMEPEVH